VSDDRWAIRQLVERYAALTDRGDGDAVAALFTDDGELVLWLDPKKDEPTSQRVGRAEIAGAIDRIGNFHATHHSIANSDVDVDGDRAHGETRCDAHHLIGEPEELRDYTMFIRYVDDFTRIDGRWMFGRRELRVQWTSSTPVEDA
jgi:ketosteroid isomerase-like protein